jgi:translocation and assembly module TamB
MQVPKIFLRITRLLSKAILILLVIVSLLLIIIHLPPVQRQITHSLSNYLSDKIEARVDIERISFSLLGHVVIEEIVVWDPGHGKIFSARKIEAATSMNDLISGDLIFDEVRISGAETHLIQRENGLNIQFILDAFKPGEKPMTPSANSVSLQFKKILLENIVFDFTSAKSGITVAIHLGTFASNDTEISTKPLKIKADHAVLQHTVVNTLSTQQVDTDTTALASKNTKFLLPDFGTGIMFEINNLELKENDFSFHWDRVMDTQKFDPAHISLTNLQGSLRDVVIREDTLAIGIQSFTVQLPGFAVTEAASVIRMNRNQLVLSGFHLASGNNTLDADLTTPLDLNSIRNANHIPLDIKLSSRINPGDLAYFFSDTLTDYFSPWGPSELTLTGSYIRSHGKLETLNLKTGNSHLHAEGMVSDIFAPEKLSWEGLVVKATVGPDFKGMINPFLKKINMPPNVSFRVASSGNLERMHADGEVWTDWGDAKFSGQVIHPTRNAEIDMDMEGEAIDLAEWLNTSSAGPVNLTANAKGMLGAKQNMKIKGLIRDIKIMDQLIHHINFESSLFTDSAWVGVSISDPKYRAEISSDISFAGPLTFTSTIQLDSFRLGRLLHADTTLIISGNTRSELILNKPSLEGNLVGERIVFRKQSIEYSLDTMVVHGLVSPAKSDFGYYTDYSKVNLVSNFDIRNIGEIIQGWSWTMLSDSGNAVHHSAGNRTAHITMELENESFLKLMGIDVDDFTSFRVNGGFDEQSQTANLYASSGKFSGYGISLDTLSANLIALRDTVSATMNAKNLRYDSIHLGNLDFDVLTQGDTALANIRLTTDSVTLFGFSAHLLPVDSGVLVYPDRLLTLNNENFIDEKSKVFVGKNNVAFDHFRISRNDMEIKLDGDLNYFDVSLNNVDLTKFNFLLSPDTTVIDHGNLTGMISYSRDHHLNLNADIDSLSLYKSNPLAVTARAVSNGNEVPFEFQVTNTSNKIDLRGNYATNSKDIDAVLLVDVNNLELFQFLVSGFVDEMHGSFKGRATIKGPVKRPAVNGSLRFLDMGLTTVKPKLTFNVQDDSIALENSSLVLNHFTLYDKEHHPLTISGNLSTKDYQSFIYDLQINSDQYTLINNPDSTSGKIRGLLVVDSDIKLKGNEKDRNVVAGLTIKDATDLTLVTSNDDVKMLKAEGIVDFVDPAVLDSLTRKSSTSLYDSLIASLPDFNLNATLAIEDQAVLRLLIDEQSGDYIEASGTANLEMDYDRTGNLRLSGNYTVGKGVYRLSFYDLVKKNFNLVQGSSINWSGSPKTGDLNIKAEHTVASNSLGLIGHEIGENEKSIYKRSLDYAVGININGTIEKPVISFSLDLPKNEKVNYPVLANKLDRLRLPEYESELNKQVFGLLVLGGFLPESSADVNSTVIATTALSNSVNSLLASQLNRFTSQHIKGVSIDVGIQSFSDYSAPGGKTQTAMDFRVSKSIMNDRLSFEIGGDFDINKDQSGANTGTKNYRGDIAIIYDLTGNGDRQLKLFNNETYDIIYQEIRNTGISLIFIREFESKEEKKKQNKQNKNK